MGLISYQKYYSLKEKKEYEKQLKILSEKTSSKDFFKGDSRRLKLHKEILEKKLNTCKVSSNPYIYFILGSIGSGKTSIKDAFCLNEKDCIYINFDELKRSLPEYDILKNINPTKAAQFVQSESATLAGNLFKKAIKKGCNIMYEKNITKKEKVTHAKEKSIHLKEEISKVFKKDYIVSFHIVFVDSFQESWKRVQNRAKKIKRFVPQQKVKDTFNNLFPYFNEIFTDIKGKNFSVFLWYNGSGIPEAKVIGALTSPEKYKKAFSLPKPKKVVTANIKDLKIQGGGFYTLIIYKNLKKISSKMPINHLKKLSFLKNAL